jgi:hypothetical protein
MKPDFPQRAGELSVGPAQARFLKRLKEDSFALGALRGLVEGGCDPGILIELLSGFYVGEEFPPFQEHIEDMRKVREIFARLQKHLSAACDEIANLREVKSLPAFASVFREIEETEAAIRAVLPVLDDQCDKRGTFRREMWLTAAILYVERHLKRQCYSEIILILDCMASADKKESSLSADGIRKIYKRYLQSGDQRYEQAQGLLNEYLKSHPHDLAPHLRAILESAGR